MISARPTDRSFAARGRLKRGAGTSWIADHGKRRKHNGTGRRAGLDECRH